MEYKHTLIAKPKEFLPSAAQVQSIMSAIVELGVVPGDLDIMVLVPNGRVMITPPNPFTGERLTIELKDRKKLATVAEIGAAVSGLSDYEVAVSGIGKPAFPVVPIEYDDSYFVEASCFVSSTLRSTSDVHDESVDGREMPMNGQPHVGNDDLGFFSNPHNGEVITVPHAGCARFWMQFGLGKFLFPKIEGNNLELLHPKVVAAAERIFQIPFVQGCNWCE